MAELKLIAEFKQLLEYDVFHGQKANSLTPQEKKRVANMINLIEEKVNRGHTQDNPIIKGRSCYNGRIQHNPSREIVNTPQIIQEHQLLQHLQTLSNILYYNRTKKNIKGNKKR